MGKLGLIDDINTTGLKIENSQSGDYRSKIREPYPSEIDFFKTRPEVAGMATEDKRIILNPFNNFNEKQKDSVARLENYRLLMNEKNVIPDFELTDKQKQFLKGTEYEKNSIAAKQSIISRILVGDPSAQDITPEQEHFANEFKKSIESTTNKNNIKTGKLGLVDDLPPKKGKLGLIDDIGKTSLPSRSIAGDVLSAAARAPLRLGQRIGSSLKYFDQPGGLDIARNIGETLTELPEKAAERFEIFKPSQQETGEGIKGLARRAITGGIEELPSSIAPALAGGATGLAIGSMIPIPGAPIIGSYVGAAAGTFGQFYTSSYQEAYEDAIKQGIPEDKARSVARKIGLIQGGIEAVTTPITLGFAMGKNVLKNLFVAPVKEGGKAIISEAGKKIVAEGTEAVLNKSIRSILTPTIKEAAKTIGKVSAIEVPQEMVQDELDALVRRQAGMEAPAFGESAIEAAGPAAVMSILMGGGGHIYSKAYTGSVKRALQNPQGIDKEARLKAAQFTASTIAEESKNPFLGQLWLDNAMKDIETGKPISLESKINDLATMPLEKPQKPKATGLKIEQPEKAEVPKFEPEPTIKVKGEGLKIEPVAEKPIEKKPVTAHEEKIIVRGEKPATKPIIEGLPKEKEIPVTLTEKGVIASEETKGQEAQESLPLVPEQGTSPETKGLPTGEAAPVVSKEPWQMNQAEYDKYIEDSEMPAKMFLTHKEEIQRAISEGREIPPEVLKDYPELQADVPSAQTVTGLSEKTFPATHTMPSGEVMPGAEHKEALTSEEGKKAETPKVPISPIEANIKKEIPERESPLTRKTLAEQMKSSQPELSDEDVEINIKLAIDAPAKALGITPDEFIQSSPEIIGVRKSTTAELKGRKVTHQQAGLSEDVVSKIETSLISNAFDDSISTSALRKYGKAHDVTISPSTSKQEAFVKLRRFMIDNPKGYDILGKRQVLTDKEYLEGKSGKILSQDKRGAIEFTDDGKAIIHILENADRSTFIHEMFHRYVEMMKRSPKLKPQLKILETWIGKPITEWTSKGKDSDHERVARSGEQYLWEGKAPTSALKAVFAKFKKWLEEIYKTARGLDIKLSDDVRKMWDEWFGGKESKLEIKQTETFTSVKSSIGTLDNIDTIALSDIFKSEIDKGTPLNKLLVKRIVAGKLGVLVGDLTPEKGYKHKAVEEAYEYAIVKKGREIAQSDMSADEKFEATKKLYAQQLNLSERTSTSIEKQQYSTPLPLAMAINEHLGIDKNTTVYEPTAGNGILLIGANPKKTVANELATDYRQTHLKDAGFSTIQGDAMTFIKDSGMEKSFDTVVMNPPFGNAQIVLFDNYRVRKLEHQIALESLKAMKDNGNAAIIIGGHNFEHGKMIEADRIFLNYLYSHFNVTHNIDINGDVYRRMGTSFPIRLITIEGRKTTPDNQFAPIEQSQVESANTFDDVRNLLGKPIQREMEVKYEDIGKEPIITRLPGKEGRRVEGVVEGRQKGDELTGRMRDIVAGTRVPDTGLVEQPGYSKDIVGDIVREERGQGRTGIPPNVTGGEGVRPQELPGQLPLPSRQSRLVDANIQEPYIPKSKGKSGNNVIPKNLITPITKTLQTIENIYGDIDVFVQAELKYKTKEELYNALSAEQIDAVSIILNNFKNGKSIILGDQTGVGKGRVLSAIIRYANLQGLKPIFFTEKPNLFSDLYRDLIDIKHTITPYILHSNVNTGAILDKEGNRLFKVSFVGELKNKIIQDPTKTMENFNILITTYDQINKENKQRAILRALAHGNIIILDEAHKAAGTSSTGEFMSKLLETASTVIYSSATYAKRPDNMAVYHKTDIGKTGLSVEGLTDAIKLGGIPLQQWVASSLAEGGQYTRTELDYSGTNLDIIVDVKNEILHTKQSDDTTSILRDIVKFDREKLKLIKKMDKEAVKEGKRTTGKDSTAAGVTSSNFSSVVHNMVGHLLLSFRADAAIDRAITAIMEGRKPVITLMSTMETFLSHTVSEGSITIGDPIGFSFKDILKKALKGTLRYTEISPGGERFKKVFKLEELPDLVQAIYQDIESKINSLETSLSSSPIDYIKSKLVKAGYTVGEITNRKLYIDYSKSVPTLEAREETERRDRNTIINAFNSGKTKILIFNAAGATGISLHASEKFATAKEQRELLIVQPQLNIDTFKQAMGRVFRKGQVSKPLFTMIQTALPAEIRPTVILQKKLASLNANTTANKESSAGLKDIPDMMNNHGDSVVSAYLKQNSEINAMLGDPLRIEADKENAVDAMQKVTGKVALLPVQIQRQFYDDIEMAYKELIEHLDQIGENNLHTKEYNFQAKTLEKQLTNQGKDESNPFASSTYLEKISVKVLKKPFTKAKIEELVKDSLKGKTAEEFNEGLLSKINDVTEQYKNTLEGELIENRKEEIQYDINFIDYAFKKFKIGHSYSIPIIEDVYTPAVLVDIKHSKTSGNPAAPSKVHLVFAAAPPYQIYKTSLSRKEFVSHADSTGEGIPSEWDELIPKEVRENRYVITGNLLQGFQRLGERAETINFTTESGEVKAGILLPRSTDINSLKEGGTTVGAKEAFEYLKSHAYIESSDKEVTIRVSKDTATINVPKSKADGAKYYLNKPILSVLDVEFSSFGNSMRSHVSVDKLLPLLETLEQETSTRFSIPAKEVKEAEVTQEKKEEPEEPTNTGEIHFQSDVEKESFIKNIVDKFSNWNEEKKAYQEAVKNGLIKEDISDDFRNKFKQWVSFPRTVAKKYPVFKRFYDRAEKYFEDIDGYATTLGNIVKPYMESSNQKAINNLLIDARLNKQYAYSKEELQKAGHSKEVVTEYLSVVNTMNQGLHYMVNMLNRSGNNIEEIYSFVAKVKGMRDYLKPYKALENKDKTNYALSKTVWGIKKSQAVVKVFKKQELIDMGLSEEERYAYDLVTKLMYKNSNYIPFKRYGNWFVAVNDEEGNLVEYSFHESQKEMRAEAMAMIEKHPAHKVTSGNVKKLATEAYQNMPVSILSMLKEFDEQLDIEFSKVYADIAGRGFPVHLVEAKKIPGFEENLSKSISDYILGISRWMAAKETRHDFSKMLVEKGEDGKLLLDPRKNSQLYGYTNRYIDYVLSSEKEGAVFRQFMFRYYLGGVVKSALLNFTQSLTVTLPVSAEYIEGSIVRRTRLMANAIKTAGTPHDSLKVSAPKLAEALQKALKDGKISEQMVKMLRGEVYGKKLGRFDKILSYMFEFAEQSNRKIAFIMAYKEATTNGVKVEGKKGGYQVLSHEEAIKFAEDFIDETQFVYSKLNKSELMRGWKAPLFTFRVFSGNYLSLLKSTMLEGEWKAFTEMLGIMLLIGGFAAFPGLKEIEKALELMGYDPKRMVKDKFGQWGDLSLHGVLYPLGADLSGAMGTIEIVPGDIQQGVVPAVGGLILGVPMDIPKRMGRAWTLLTKNKDVYRAVEAVMPEAIRNPMVAVRWIKEGEAKSPSYEPITKVGRLDTAFKFLGIQPATLTKAYEREHSESILRNLNYSEGYNWRIAKAIYTKDSDGYKKLLKEISEHNIEIGKAISGGNKEAVKKYILVTRQGIQRNLLKMVSPQMSEIKSMPKVLRPAYREIQKVMK